MNTAWCLSCLWASLRPGPAMMRSCIRQQEAEVRRRGDTVCASGSSTQAMTSQQELATLVAVGLTICSASPDGVQHRLAERRV